MLMIRLSRTGKPKQPYFRILVSEKTKDPWGKYLEMIGNYNPRSKKLELKKDRFDHWVKSGAQITDSLHNILVKENVIEGKAKRAYGLTKKRLGKINTEKTEQAAKEAAAKQAAKKPVEPEIATEETTPEAPAEN